MAKKLISTQKAREIKYAPVPTGAAFHYSDKFLRGIKGPVGSGKSSCCAMELLSRAHEQRPWNGVRYTRFAIIRNFYPELRDTTLKTWLEWVPESICPINHAPPMTGKMTQKLDDGTIVDMEVVFLALDRDEDVEKLMSLELTGAWINEARYIPWGVVRDLRPRVNRYPSKKMGGQTWHGVVMDTNPPDTESWWYKLAEIEKPVNAEFFSQPPALLMSESEKKGGPPVFTPNRGQGAYLPAENISNLNSGFDYYLNLVPGSDIEWIKVMILGQYGSAMGGKPVYPEYIDDMHCAKKELEPYRGLPLLIGFDWGLTPAAAILQISPQGQLRIIDEIVTGLSTEDLQNYPHNRYAGEMGIRRFARELLRPYLNNTYPNMLRTCIGDPAGSQRAQTNENTCLQIMAEEGFPTEMASTNNFIARREAVSNFMTRMIGKDPGFLLSPRCRFLRYAFQGKYHYRKMRMQSGVQYSATPEKNLWSHISDALQYGALHAESASSITQSPRQGRGQRREVVTSSSGGWT